MSNRKARKLKEQRARRSVLDTISSMDAAAKGKLEESDIPQLHTAKAEDVLWTLKKHRYTGW